MYSVVLLPQPEGPSRPTSFPSGIVTQQLLTATTSSPDLRFRLGNTLVTLRNSTFIGSIP